MKDLAGIRNRYITDGVVTPLIDGVAADDYKISRFQFRFVILLMIMKYIFGAMAHDIFLIYTKAENFPKLILSVADTVYDLKSSTEEVIYEDVMGVDFGHIEGVDTTVAIKALDLTKTQ